MTTLSHAAFRVLVLLAAQYGGFNNGALGITAGQAAKAGILSDKTLREALKQLERRNLVEKTYPASHVPPRPTMWAISWLPIDDTKYSNATRKPSHAYQEWRPEPGAE